MDSLIHTSFNAEDRSYFAILKKEIHQIAELAGFTGNKAGVVDIIVAEMTSNLVKHAGGGEILVAITREKDNEAIEIISIDGGPGISDPQKMLEDGISTSNTLGHGLGAIKRLSDTFQIYSLKDWGTIVLSRVYKKELPQFTRKNQVEVRGIVVCKPGEKVSGDGMSYVVTDKCLKVFHGDGLGHGKDANAAVASAIDSFRDSCGGSPVEILRTMHVDVKKTRGLVAAVGSFSFSEKKWSICGVGNISARTITPTDIKNFLSYNGIVGMNMPNTLKEQEADHVRGQILVMCSDGIKSRWDLQKYTGIYKHDLSIIAAAIYKDFARKTDDMSVLVAKVNSAL